MPSAAALSECYQRKHLRTEKQTESLLRPLSLCHLWCPNVRPGVLPEERAHSGLRLVALGPSSSNTAERKGDDRRQQGLFGTENGAQLTPPAAWPCGLQAVAGPQPH